MDKANVVYINIQRNIIEPLKRKQILPFATARIDPWNIMLWDLSQTQRDNYRTISLPHEHHFTSEYTHTHLLQENGDASLLLASLPETTATGRGKRAWGDKEKEGPVRAVQPLPSSHLPLAGFILTQ